MAVVKDMNMAQSIFTGTPEKVAELEKYIKLGEKKAAEMQALINEQKAKIAKLEDTIEQLKDIIADQNSNTDKDADPDADTFTVEVWRDKELCASFSTIQETEIREWIQFNNFDKDWDEGKCNITIYKNGKAVKDVWDYFYY